MDELKHLKKEYMKLPKQSFKCKLAGIQQTNQGSPSGEACTKFNDIVIDREFNLTVVDLDVSGSYKVHLVEQNPRNLITLDVSKTLIDAGLVEPENSYLNKGIHQLILPCCLAF